jgi:parallel beta-helix repeat protein
MFLEACNPCVLTYKRSCALTYICSLRHANPVFSHIYVPVFSHICSCRHANPVFSSNTVMRNRGNGIYIFEEGRGEMDGNALFAFFLHVGGGEG